MLQASPSDPQLWRQNLEATSDSGAWSVIFTGPGMHDNLAAVAPKHPNQKYVFFDDELKRLTCCPSNTRRTRVPIWPARSRR